MQNCWGIRMVTLCVVGLLGCGAGLDDAEGAGGGGAALHMRAFSSFEDASRRARVRIASAPAHARTPLRFDDPSGTVYLLRGAHIWVEAITLTFRAQRSCAQILADAEGQFARLRCDGGRLRLAGPFAVDLVDGRIEGGLAEDDSTAQVGWQIPALDYRQVELLLGPGPSVAPMRGSTVWGEANFQLNAAIRTLGVQFAFRAQVTRAVRAPVRDGAALVVWADVARWLDHIPLTECLERGHLGTRHGRVALDSALDAPALTYFVDEPPLDCQDAQAQFRRNLSQSLSVDIRAPHDGESVGNEW